MDRVWLYAGLSVAAAVGLVRALRGPRIEPGKTRLLLVGDSLAVGLAPPMRAIAKDQSVVFDSIAKEGTRIDQWASSAALGDKIVSFQPSLALVSLGTNDEYLEGDGAAERQRGYLRQLLQRFADARVPVVWIGPPKLPRPTNGVVAMIRSEVPGTNYFPSQLLEIPRGPDQIHPTARGYAGWAGSIWQWLS